MKTEIQKIRRLAQPLMDYLQENSNSYCAFIVTQDKVEKMSVDISIPNKKGSRPVSKDSQRCMTHETVYADGRHSITHSNIY